MLYNKIEKTHYSKMTLLTFHLTQISKDRVEGTGNQLESVGSHIDRTFAISRILETSEIYNTWHEIYDT